MKPRWLLLGALGLAASCTLGDLADYEVELCEPASSAADDVCTRLNDAAQAPCQVFSCNPATQRCQLGPPDDDRDGETSAVCGGSDCNDHDPRVGAEREELCEDDGPHVDNDCDGAIDQRLAFAPSDEAAVSSATDVRLEVVSGEIFASFVQKRASGQCIQAVGARGAIAEGCAFGPTVNDPAFLPRQPSVVPVGKTGFGTAYVETGAGCARGTLGYRVFDTTGRSVYSTLACGDGGVALPSLSMSSNARSATIAFYEAALPSHDDPFDDCAALQPARLRLTRVERADSSTARLLEPWPRPVSDTSLAVRAPALLRLGEQLLLAAPADNAAKVWRVDEATGAVDAGQKIPGFDGARSVSMAHDGAGQLAFVAQVGCQPQSLELALARWDEATRTLSFETGLQVVAPTTSLAADPKATWLRERGEWLVTWLEVGPSIHALRLTPAGATVGAPFRLLDGAEAAAADTEANVLGFEGSTSDGSFVRGALGCGDSD